MSKRSTSGGRRLPKRDAQRDPLRIAVVGTRGVPSAYSGLETSTENLYAILAARGHDVTVYCRREELSTFGPTYRGMTQVCLPAVKRRAVETISHVGASLAHATTVGDFDLLHLQALAPGLFTPLQSLWRTPTVSTIHGLDWQRAKWKGAGGKLLHRAERSIVRHVRDVTVVSRDLQKYFREAYGKETTYIPNGVNRVDDARPLDDAPLAAFGLIRGRYLVCVGRLVPEKRLEDLIRAFRVLRTDHRLVLVGEGAYAAAYVQSLRDEAASDPRVVFTGRLEGATLASVFGSAAAFISPSELEGLPNALLEAVEYSLPVAVSSIAPHHEILDGVGDRDLFFPVGDVAAIAARIQSILDHPDHARDVALRARDRVREEYSWVAVADRTEELFREVVMRAQGAGVSGRSVREAPNTVAPTAASTPSSRYATVGIADRKVETLRAATCDPRDVRLSVVVPNYNTAEFIVAAVRSILRQTMSALEVIVVDDGSTDDGVERVLAIDDPRLTVVRQPNRGLAGARNTGILLARGPFIGLCDSDDLWHPQKAERHLAMMDADPSLALTFSFSEYLDERGTGTGRLLVSTCDEPSARDLVERNHVGNGSTPIIRTETFSRAGLFDEELNACADLEMWIRIAAHSLRIRRIPEVLTGYRVRDGSMSATFDYFLADARRLAERVATVAPEIPSAVVRRGYAESVRIASRKALAGGNVAMSRQLLVQAVREYPMLPLIDLRAFAMTALHVASSPLPAGGAAALYRWGSDAARHAYALALGRRASQGLGEIWKAAAA